MLSVKVGLLKDQYADAVVCPVDAQLRSISRTDIMILHKLDLDARRNVDVLPTGEAVLEDSLYTPYMQVILVNPVIKLNPNDVGMCLHTLDDCLNSIFTLVEQNDIRSLALPSSLGIRMPLDVYIHKSMNRAKLALRVDKQLTVTFVCEDQRTCNAYTKELNK